MTLNRNEIKLWLVNERCIPKLGAIPLPDLVSFEKNVRDWTDNRNEEGGTVNWQFRTMMP